MVITHVSETNLGVYANTDILSREEIFTRLKNYVSEDKIIDNI